MEYITADYLEEVEAREEKKEEEVIVDFADEILDMVKREEMNEHLNNPDNWL